MKIAIMLEGNLQRTALRQNIVMNKFPESSWVLYIISHYVSTFEITGIWIPVKGVILVEGIQAFTVVEKVLNFI